MVSLRHSLAAIASVVVLGGVQACTGSAQSAATPGDSLTGVSVSTSGSTIHVTNTTNSPLTDVDVTINAVGGAGVYTKTVGTLAAGEDRVLTLDDVHGKNGESFNRMFVVPKTVVVTAADQSGKKQQMSVAWK